MSEQLILLVEGEDDKHVVEHLYRRVHGDEAPLPFKIENKESYEKLLEGLPQHLKSSGLQVLGIVVDANDDPKARWREIRDAAANGGVDLPAEPAPNGTFVEGCPRVGAWLMPNNTSPGELEDFARGLIPRNDRVWPLAKAYIAGIPKEDRLFKPGKIVRANLYAWLASRELPGRIGRAIRVGDLNAEAPVAQQFANWLSDLFGE